MAKITLTDLTSLANDTSATNSINENFQAVEDYINNKVLSRVDDGETNTLQNDVDFNSNSILNVANINGEALGDIISGATTAKTGAETAQTAAETAQASAETAQTAAEAAQAAAESSYDNFDDRYLGAKAANPALDNDGDALITGALYFNTVSSEMRVWDGAAWEAAYLPATGYAELGASNTWTAAQIASTYTATTSGSVTLDFSTYNNFIITLNGNITLANPSTETAGQSGNIIFIQDGTGSRTLTLGSEYLTANGAGITLTTTAAAIDVVPYVVAASGSILLGFQGDFS